MLAFYLKDLNMNQKQNIIICDDDLTDIILFKKFLGVEKLKNINLIELRSSSELIETLKNSSNTVDLIFLDYYLDNVKGIDLLPKIKNDFSIPVVMLTGMGDEKIAVECMKEGAVDYIPKDQLETINIIKVITQAIQRYEIEKERDLLLGITAHELRNPISVILGYTEILQSYKDLNEDKKLEIIQTVSERANYLLAIINQLLDITRIEKGIITLERETIELNSFIKKIITNFEFQAHQKKIKIDFTSSKNEFLINLDKNKIEEVITNLIDNSLKYSEQNTIVKVSLSEEVNKIVISVQDQGQGIKEEELKYLFKLFSNKKVSTVPTAEESSTGLGLAICKKVIEAHGGQIIVQSEYGAGSKFTVELPVV
jgi:two-component system sensor histidine kinase/response regulator